ncbi:hypothetical protein C8R43DRAFT_1043113 [Mycena crocata]|nr:hypothetical protein C8R43DRAFT_1043113 [Mycena crocata]
MNPGCRTQYIILLVSFQLLQSVVPSKEGQSLLTTAGKFSDQALSALIRSVRLVGLVSPYNGFLTLISHEKT